MLEGRLPRVVEVGGRVVETVVGKTVWTSVVTMVVDWAWTTLNNDKNKNKNKWIIVAIAGEGGDRDEGDVLVNETDVIDQGVAQPLMPRRPKPRTTSSAARRMEWGNTERGDGDGEDR